MDKEKIAHLLYCPFTGLGRINRGDKWLQNRINIFKQFVANSLTSQTNLRYTLWISWRPEDKTNAIVQEFYRQLLYLDRVTVVFTYEGLCFYDDKYPDEEAKTRLYENLRRTLPSLIQHTDFADEVRVTIQPSDDIYHLEMTEEIQTTDSKPFSIIGYTKGYITNLNTKEIAEYNPDTTPPFYTLVMTKEQFQDHQKHFELIKDIKSHEYVKDYNYIPLKTRGFIVGTHGANISTTWNILFKGRKLSKEEADDVWIKFGNYFTEPMKLKIAKHLLLRKVYNILPCKKLLKKLYYYVQ